MTDSLTHALAHRVRTAQAEQRIPGVAALVSRDGEAVFSDAVGVAEIAGGTPVTADTQFRIGSITKTFTAAAIMQLRDAGALRLDDALSDHLSDTPHSGLRLRDLLSHLSGLQREFPGDVWDLLVMPDRAELLATLGDAEAVLEPRTAFHYSNLAFALLGEVVAEASGTAYEQYVKERLWAPLGLRRTSWTAEPPAASGYLIRPYDDGAEQEPELDLGGGRAAGQLWSTVADLAVWGACLAGAHPDVLSERAVGDMHHLQTMHDQVRWSLGYGLGLCLYRRGDRVFAGHGGAMPGFLSGLIVHRAERLVAVVLTNASSVAEPEALGVELLNTLLDREPPFPEPFRASERPPAELAELAGRWWSEGSEFVFRVRNGRLEGQVGRAAKHVPWAVFEPDGSDRYRVASGRERGEQLRLERDAGGRVQRMFWAGYPFERTPRPSGPAGAG